MIMTMIKQNVMIEWIMNDNDNDYIECCDRENDK